MSMQGTIASIMTDQKSTKLSGDKIGRHGMHLSGYGRVGGGGLLVYSK